MTTQELAPNEELEQLIGQLDEWRDYGPDRTYEEVIEQARSGQLILRPGLHGLPWIADARTRRTVKGTAAPLPGPEASLPSWSRSRFNERASQDFDEAYDELREMMPKSAVAQRIFWETLLGRAMPSHDSTVPNVVKEFLEHMSRPPEKPVVDVD